MRTPQAFKIFFTSLFCVVSLNPLFAKWETINHSNSAVEVFLPKKVQTALSAQSSARFALMINLHGCAQKPQTLREEGNWDSAAEEFDTIIAIPNVPDGGIYASCWDYYGLDHQRDNRHNAFILSLVEELKKKYPVAANQIYISGLSSGGGLTMVMACLAPDVFAGVGLNAGPSLGSSAFETTNATLSIEQVVKECKKLAANNAYHIKTITASVIYGDNDYIVDPDYNKINAIALAKIIKTDKEGPIEMEKIPGTNLEGKGTLYFKNSKPLVSLIENKGIGHAWPAGQGGASGNFIAKDSINYPKYLLKFLISNNQRL